MLQVTNYTDPASRIPGDVGNRQWFYQTCTQFGWYQSSDQQGLFFFVFVDVILNFLLL